MTTNLELYISAHDLAEEWVKPATNHTLHTAGLERFNAEKRDPVDWDYWFAAFNSRREYLIGLSTQAAASVVKAKLEAAKKPAVVSSPSPLPSPPGEGVVAAAPVTTAAPTPSPVPAAAAPEATDSQPAGQPS